MRSIQKYIQPSLLAMAVTASGNVAAALQDPIIVTAQKREQSSQDVGISVTAMSGPQMEALGYKSSQEVTSMATGVSTIQPNGEANYALAIRGVANSDFTTNVESPVAIYVDEVYISQMSGAGFMLFDMDRVEILKGPQGTLFGRNATGGLAHFVTARPSQDNEGYVKGTVGDFGQIKVEGAMNGALTDRLAGRVSFAHHENDGYSENEFDGSDLNNADDQAYRAQVMFEATDDLSILFNIRGAKQDIRTGFYEHVSTAADGSGTILSGSTPNPLTGYVEVDHNTDPHNGSFDSPGFNELETAGYSATVNWYFSDTITISSVTDFSTVERQFFEDTDASPIRAFNLFLETDSEQFSQEFRVLGETPTMTWVAGFYYLDLDVSDSNGMITDGLVEAPESEGGFGLSTPESGGLYNPYTSELQSFSVFGQIEYAFSDKLKGTLGVRVINDEKEFEYSSFIRDFSNANFATKAFLDGSTELLNLVETASGEESYRGVRDDTEVAIRAQLDYNVSENLLAYASFNRGVKGGGFNAPVFPIADASLGYNDDTMSYDPETLNAYELGFKKTVMNGRARLNGAVYYYDYEDYQAFEVVGVDTFTRNAEAESVGAELDFQGAVTENLEMMIGVAYNDVDVTLANGQKTTSVQSPELALNVMVRYHWQIGDGELSLQADASYRDEHYFSLSGVDAVKEDGYTLVNASVTYVVDHWRISAHVSNLTDEEYVVQAFELGANLGLTEQYYGRPQWFGLTAQYSW